MIFISRLTIYLLFCVGPLLIAEEQPTSLAKKLYQSYHHFTDKNKNQPINFAQIGDSEKFLIQIGTPIFEPLPKGDGFSLKAKDKNKEWIFIAIWPSQLVPDSEDYRKILLPEGAVFIERRNVSFKGDTLLIQILCPEISIDKALSVTNEILLN